MWTINILPLETQTPIYRRNLPAVYVNKSMTFLHTTRKPFIAAFLLLSLVLISCGKKEYFEGQITYSINQTSSIPQLQQMFDQYPKFTLTVLSTKDGNYANQLTGAGEYQMELTRMDSAMTYIWAKQARMPVPAQIMKLAKTQIADFYKEHELAAEAFQPSDLPEETIAGYVCKPYSVKIPYEQIGLSEIIFWVTDQINVPEIGDFESLNQTNLRVKGLPGLALKAKYIINTRGQGDASVEYLATAITPGPVDSLVALPAGVPIVDKTDDYLKSQYKRLVNPYGSPGGMGGDASPGDIPEGEMPEGGEQPVQ